MKPAANAPSSAPTQNATFLLAAFRRMAVIRAFEAKCLELSRSDPPVAVGSIHLCAGQEAIPVGARAALHSTDHVVATYRGHGWALESGITARELLLEVAHRAGGINGGRAGSAMVMAPQRGFVGENSIVGAGGPIATGVALACARRGSREVVVVSFGDGAMSQGSLHESMVFAAAENLPVIFICENNGWAELTATKDTIKVEKLSLRAQGYGIPGMTIDGNDPCVVRDAVLSAAARARQGQGPSLIECQTFRLWGHYNRDLEHYRDRQDRQRAQANDPLLLLEKRLIEQGTATAESLAQIKQSIEREIAEIADEVSSSPRPDPASARDHVFSSKSFAPIPAGLGTSVPAPQELAFWQAINAALKVELATKKEVLVYGEDVGKAGGIFGVTRYLQKEFGANRVFDMPIAESAILGSAVGAAMMGMRPVVEIMWADFMLVALDQLVNQAANVRYITQGETGAPIVVRTQQGATPGSCAQHSQCLEALLFHIPGLRIALPATPQDAYDLLRAALAGDDPTIIIEARSLYLTKQPVIENLDLQRARGAVRRREGRDLVIITWGTTLSLVMEAAAVLQSQDIDAAVLDLRWLSPLDDAAIDRALAECDGRVLIVHEANLTGGVGAEIAARISERHWSNLRAAVRRVGTKDVRMPASPILQQAVLPTVDRIVRAARALKIGETES